VAARPRCLARHTLDRLIKSTPASENRGQGRDDHREVAAQVAGQASVSVPNRSGSPHRRWRPVHHGVPEGGELEMPVEAAAPLGGVEVVFHAVDLEDAVLWTTPS
jgi:hypothetical protein